MFTPITAITLMSVALALLCAVWGISIWRTNWFSGYSDRFMRFVYMICVGSAITIDLILVIISYNEYEVSSVFRHISGILLWTGLFALLRIKGSFLPMRARTPSGPSTKS